MDQNNWIQYEIDSRESEKEISDDPNWYENYYGGKPTSKKIVQALTKRSDEALVKATKNLSSVLRKIEERLCDGEFECLPFVASTKPLQKTIKYNIVPNLTSYDLEYVASNPAARTNNRDLEELSRAVFSLAAGSGNFDILPVSSTPEEVIEIDDSQPNVAILERTHVPLAKNREGFNKALATQFNDTAEALKTQIGIIGGAKNKTKTNIDQVKKRAQEVEKITRGAELAAAVAAGPPLELLDVPLPFENNKVFDYKDGKIITHSNNPTDGVYYGIAHSNYSYSRQTELKPLFLEWCANITSGQVYAWVVVNSSEGNYIIRASDTSGKLLNFNKNSIIKWMQSHLYGNPPHKIKVETYIDYLKKNGFEIYSKTHDIIRFDLESMTTKQDRTAKIEQMAQMNQADFDALDWSEYDHLVSACNQPYEISGDVGIENKKIKVYKIRKGIPYATYNYPRAYIDFHTHPSARYKGLRLEIPSFADLSIILQQNSRQVQAWSFITAPEGTYILRSSFHMRDNATENREKTNKHFYQIYESLNDCSDSPEVCKKNIFRALRDSGFIVFFHDNPCLKLSNKPIVPWATGLNLLSRADYKKDIAFTQKLTADDLASADWSQIDDILLHPLIDDISFCSARIEVSSHDENQDENQDEKQKRTNINIVLPITDAGIHGINDINSQIEWYNFPSTGPLFIIYFPVNIPLHIPDAAFKAASRNQENWIWVIFLSPKQVLAIQANENGMLTHGPIDRVI